MEVREVSEPGLATAAAVIRKEAQAGRIEPLARAASVDEAGVVADLMGQLGLSTFVDLGCWTGVLLEEVLRQAAPRRVLAVDAVPELLEIARSRVDDPRVSFECVTLLPEAREVWDHEFRMPTNDSSSSGLFVESGVVVRAGPRRVLTEFLRERLASLDSAYLKLDVEGLDAIFVTDLLRAGMRFPVIHFEVLPWIDCGRAMDALRADGYVVPPLVDGHRFYSLACSRSSGVLVGFCPNRAYPAVRC